MGEDKPTRVTFDAPDEEWKTRLDLTAALQKKTIRDFCIEVLEKAFDPRTKRLAKDPKKKEG